MDNTTENQKLIGLNVMEIQKYLRNRYPFLLIDYIEEVVPGKSAKGYKNLSYNEWYFQGHFPEHPVMPGVLQLEAIFQMGAMALHTLPENHNAMSYIVRVSNVSYLKNAVPGDKLDISTELLSWKRGIGKGRGIISVNGITICKAEYTHVIKEELEKQKEMMNNVNDE